jgi:hypothetical protein
MGNGWLFEEKLLENEITVQADHIWSDHAGDLLTRLGESALL